MGSPHDRTAGGLRRAALAGAATVASGGALFFGTGLHPLAWLTWFAVLPVLLVVPRLRWWTAGLVAFAAWLTGEVNQWGYLTGDIGMPWVRAGLVFTAAAVLFAVAGLAFRGLVRRGRWVAATLVPPALWVGFEYLFGLASPDGACGAWRTPSPTCCPWSSWPRSPRTWD
jgi:apolipoprotein N-acyltransferase